MSKFDLEPHEVVVDIVLEYSSTMPRMGQAAVLRGNLVLCTRNHRGMAVSLSFPVHFEGEPIDGDAPRFVLRKIAPGVWKPAPSVLHPLLHAFLTVVGVPDDVPWGVAV